jgi:hypothetical protein
MGVRAVVDYAALKWAQDEIIIKELDVDGSRLIESHLFRRPYAMFPNMRENEALKEIYLIWDDWHIRILAYQHSSVNQ